MYVVIVGGGNVGYYLTKMLLSEGYEVTLLDWSHERVDILKNEIGDNVMFGNGTSIDGLEKAGCSRADVIVATTGDDEDNLAVCQYGKLYFNIPKAIARITNPKNERIFKELGVGTTVSGTGALAEALERYVAKKSLKTLLTFNHDEMVLVETELPDDSPVINKKVSQLTLPGDCVLALILRDNKVIFINSNSELMAKDLVIAISTANGQDNLKKMLLGSTDL
jgi:trk system potassium uptake protein